MQRVAGVLFVFAAGGVGCALVSGLDALEVCGEGATCGPIASDVGSDGSKTGTSEFSDSGQNGGLDGASPVGDGSGLFDVVTLDDRAIPPNPSDAPDDSPVTLEGSVEIACGKSTCTNGAACCLSVTDGAICELPDTCAGTAIECASKHDCAAGAVCCGKGWGNDSYKIAQCTKASDCNGYSTDDVLCQPDGGPGECSIVPGYDCVGNFTRAGVTFRICD